MIPIWEILRNDFLHFILAYSRGSQQQLSRIKVYAFQEEHFRWMPVCTSDLRQYSEARPFFVSLSAGRSARQRDCFGSGSSATFCGNEDLGL
jgi:hypothetical protein